MKILIIPSWYYDCDRPLRGIFFKEQALALKKAGHDIIVVYIEIISLRGLFQKKCTTGIFYEKEEGLPTYRVFWYNWFPKLKKMKGLNYYHALNKVEKILQSKKWIPDIIHAHSVIWGGYAAFCMGKKKGISVVITEHSTAYIRNMIQEYQKPIIKKVFTGVKKVIAVGPLLMDELTKYINSNKIIMVPNMVNMDTYKFTELRTNQKFIFFSLAFLQYKKGFDILLHALARMKHNNIKLRIGGDGEERENLNKLAADLGLDNKVVFLGNLSRKQVQTEMSSCNAFVLASRFETFGVVFIEALASGKPIIATRCGGPEIIVNNKNGILVKKEDPEALSLAMDKIIDNYDTYDSINIRKDCEERFSEEAITRQLNDIYTKVLNSKR